MIGLDRRTVLAAVAGVAAWPAAARAPRLRVNARSEEGGRQLRILARALPELRRTGAWARQVALHADMTHQQHGSWRFLPWHRAQLVWFERMVSAAAGEPFNLPYWDWTTAQPLPDELFDLPELTIRGLAVGGADRRIRKGQGVPGSYRARFEGSLGDEPARFLGGPMTQTPAGPAYHMGSAEQHGHAWMHAFAGGDMTLAETAPNDPAFWLHHANVDRIWASWSRQWSAASEGRIAYPEAWLSLPIGGFEDEGGARVADARSADFLDPGALVGAYAPYSYAYDRLLPPGARFAARERGAVVEAQSFSLTMRGSDGVFSIPRDLAAFRRRAEAAGRSLELAAELEVVVLAQPNRRRCLTFDAPSAEAEPVVTVFPMRHAHPTLCRTDASRAVEAALGDGRPLRLRSFDPFDPARGPLQILSARITGRIEARDRERIGG